MATSLIKSMSRLCVSKQAVSLTSTNELKTRPFISWCKNVSHLSPSTFMSAKTIPTNLQSPITTRVLQNSSPVDVPVRTVTYEIKQWREHRVINRFYRLHWGAWIRCKGGRNKKLYRKTPNVRWLLKQHIFCNKTQSKKLDRLVTPQWREPKYYVDSPYEPYHQRTNFPQFAQRKKFYP